MAVKITGQFNNAVTIEVEEESGEAAAKVYMTTIFKLTELRKSKEVK